MPGLLSRSRCTGSQAIKIALARTSRSRRSPSSRGLRVETSIPPNNTLNITCYQQMKQCWSSEVEAIGDKHIGRLAPINLTMWPSSNRTDHLKYPE
jgi:hypothetical protein